MSQHAIEMAYYLAIVVSAPWSTSWQVAHKLRDKAMAVVTYDRVYAKAVK